MDSKSLAKSKRAHSQHHSTNKKHHHKTKPSSSPSAFSGKPIPSNWDRYDEESELVGPSDVVLPKSKGADYTHLLSEAQSQTQSQFQFDNDDDVLSGEWSKGIMSMLSAQGDIIMSWIRNDNFAVDDNTAASHHHHHELSFWSLNLHSLAEQLEKVKLSQRLYIDADILPPELIVEGLESTSCQSTDLVQATFIDKGARVTSTSGEFPVKFDVADQEIEIMISSSPESEPLDSMVDNLESFSIKKIDVDPSELGRFTSQKKPPEVNTQGRVKPFADVPDKKVATFKAATAEEELDMLLDSFNETKLSGLSSLDDEAAVSPLQLPGKGMDSVNLDDELDDLMNKISVPNSHARPSHTQANMHVHDFQPASQTGSKSKELDDFDSWFDTL